MITSGKSSTAAGLTASVVKEAVAFGFDLKEKTQTSERFSMLNFLFCFE